MAATRFGDVTARLEAAIGRVTSLGAMPMRLSAHNSPEARELDDSFDPRREQEFEFLRQRKQPREAENEADDTLPRLPETIADHASYVGWSFLICVVIPALCIFTYYGFFAADQYVSEFKFSVTESTPILPSLSAPSTSNVTSGTSSAIAGIASAFTGGSVPASQAAAQNYIVIDYLMSRQAIDDLQKRIKVKSLFEGPEIKWDPVAGFNSSDSTEDFVRYWSSMVSATYDPITGIATVRVRAFTREKSLLIANAMVKLAEELVNTIARRPQLDAIKYTEGEVTRAESALERARSVLEEFRAQEGVIEPSASVSTNSELIKAVKANLVQLRTEYLALSSQKVGATSVTAAALAARISATERQLERLQFEVSKENTDGRKLMKTVSRYEKLDLDRQYAQAMVMSTRQAYDQARANAAAQHLYLTPFVRPSLPESSAYPKRLQASMLRIGMLVGLWIAGMMLVQAVREHLHL